MPSSFVTLLANSNAVTTVASLCTTAPAHNTHLVFPHVDSFPVLVRDSLPAAQTHSQAITLSPLPCSCSVHRHVTPKSRQPVQETPTVNMPEQYEEALANGAGPSTAGRQSELGPAPEAAPSSSYVATKSEHEPQEGGFAATQADSDQHEGAFVSTKPLSDRQIQEPSASQSASAASAQTGAQLDQHSASAAEPASHATDQIIQKASNALRAKDKPAEAQSSAVMRQPAAVLGSAPHHLLPETDQPTSSANERAVSGVQAEGEQPLSVISSPSSQFTAVPSVPAKLPYSPAAVKARSGSATASATASVRSERLPSATQQGTADMPTDAESTAANITAADTSAAEATAASAPAADLMSAKAARSLMVSDQATASAPSAVTAAETTAAKFTAVNAAADTSAAESTAAGATAAHAQVAGSDATAAASNATADHSADSPAATTGLTPTNADTSDGMPSATAGPAQGASSLSMQPAAGQPSDRAAASPKSPHAPSSGAPATANAAFALPNQATQAEAVCISPVVISDSAGAVPSTDEDVEKASSLASSPSDIAETDHASSATQETENSVPNSTVDTIGSRAAASSPRSTEVATGKSPVTVKASLSLSEAEEGQPGYTVTAHASEAAEGRATPRQPSALTSNAGARLSADAGAAEGRSIPSRPSALNNQEKAKPPANANAAEGKAAPSSPSLISKAESVAGVTFAAKARAASGSPAADPDAEAEPSQSTAAPFFDVMAAAKLSPATLKAISDAKATKEKTQGGAAPRGPVTEGIIMAPQHAASRATAAAASSSVTSASKNPAVSDTAQRMSAAHKPGKPAVTPVFAMVAASGESAAASQATASRASAADKLTVRCPGFLPPVLDLSFKPSFGPAFAAGADASLWPRPFSFAPVATGSPLPPMAPNFRSTSAAAASLAAANGTQAAQTGAEPKPASASEGGNGEGQWEVVPGAEHLEQLKDAKARWLSRGATSTIKK